MYMMLDAEYIEALCAARSKCKSNAELANKLGLSRCQIGRLLESKPGKAPPSIGRMLALLDPAFFAGRKNCTLRHVIAAKKPLKVRLVCVTCHGVTPQT